MGLLADISHLYGEDIAVSGTGDIAVVTANTRTIQRVIRRLLTSQTTIKHSAYPWEPSYGCGLAEKVGSVFTPSEIQAIVLSQLLQEASIAPTPAPIITVTPIETGGCTIDIFAYDNSGTPQNFSFNVS